MLLVRKNFTTKVKDIVDKILRDNLFLLSSSISYYSALALAPFALILLSVASFLGEGLQEGIVKQTSQTMSPEVGLMIKLVFDNVNEGVNLGSVSGLIGAVILLSTASLVFLQFRYSFDVIYGYYDPRVSKPIKMAVKERLTAMIFVLAAAVVFLGTSFATGVFLKIFGGEGKQWWSSFVVLYMNFMVYLGMFTAIHYYVPSRRFSIHDTLKKAALSSLFFMFGNFLLASYLKGIAADSVYGAAGTILVFLTWAYYSSFVVFLSVVVFQYLKKIGKVS